MLKYKWFLSLTVLLLPLLSFAADTAVKKTFFPGRSWYFWIFTAAGFFIYYLFYTNRNTSNYYNKPLLLGMLFNVSMLFLCFMGVNIFMKEPAGPVPVLDPAPEIAALLYKDALLYKEAEKNFTDPLSHDRYIAHHFTIPMYWKDSTGKVKLRDDFSLQNLYYDHLDFTDSTYVEMGRLGLGIFFFRIDSLKTSMKFLSGIHSPNVPFVNYYKSRIALVEKDTTAALLFLHQSIRVQDRFKETAHLLLIKILEVKKDYASLNQLMHKPGSMEYFSNKLKLKLYFNNKDLLNYYSILFSILFGEMHWLGVTAASVIMLVWLFYIIRIDIFEKEKLLPLVVTLLLGMVFIFLVFLISDFGEVILGNKKDHYWGLLLHYLVNVGLVEESVKILPLLFIILLNKRILNEAYDYVLYACISALGFSFIENILYFQQDLTNIIYGRALTSVPAHMIGSSIVAYGFVLSRYRYKNFPVYLSFPIFLALGALVHGLYDFWAFTHTYALFVFHLLFSVSLWIIIINNCMNNSPHFSYRMKFKSENLQLFLSIALTGILIMQYLILSIDQGPSKANHSLNSTLLIGGMFIFYYSDKLTNMDLVKGYWNTITYRSIGDKRRSAPFSLRMFFIRLISGDIITHSFVGMNILIQTDQSNVALLMLFHRIEKAEIVDRLVITCVLKSTGELYKDPYWFQINTPAPLIPGGDLSYYIRFSDDRPSFKRNPELIAYLFCLKDSKTRKDMMHRNDLRSLGRVRIRKQA